MRTCHHCRKRPVKRGKSRCEPCLAVLREAARTRRERHRDAGRCPECGRECEPGYIQCAYHAAKLATGDGDPFTTGGPHYQGDA